MKTRAAGITPGTKRPARGWTSAIAVVGISSIVAACGGGAAGGPAPAAEQEQAELPTHVPVTYAEPDIAGEHGVPDGYLSMPTELARVFDEPPGAGGTYTAMTPLWGAIPPTEGNAYFDAVSEAMGTTLQLQISDGNTYGDKLAAVLSSPRDVPDWVSIPTWNFPPRFGQAVGTIFEDLTPFLEGDAVEAYPNLANIPTDAWKSCMWNGRIYGLPFPAGGGISDATFYRSDLVPDAELPTNADEMVDFVVEQTEGGQWGTNDLWVLATQMFAVPPADKWVVGEDGELVHRIETQEYRDALAWMQELYASGAVHPDAVADNTADAKQRFESGEVVVGTDGIGAWHEALARMLPSNPGYEQSPIPVFAADGGEPVLYKRDAAQMCSYLKQAEDDTIEELLRAANFLASPFGTQEHMLVANGLEGVHYTLDADGLPVKTPLAQTEVQPTYMFLISPPAVTAQVQFPQYVEGVTRWNNDAAQYVVEDPFYGMRITEPNQFASLSQPFEDLEKGIARGRQSLDDLDAAIETWRTSGGEEMRAFYQGILDEQSGAESEG